MRHKRTRPSDHLVRDHTQRPIVDRIPVPPSQAQFGRNVLERSHQTGHNAVLVQRFRIAQVRQLVHRSPAARILFDDNILRFNIAMRNLERVQIGNRRSQASQNVTRLPFGKAARVGIGVQLLAQIATLAVLHDENGHGRRINAIHFGQERVRFDGQSADNVLVLDAVRHVVDFAVPPFDGDLEGRIVGDVRVTSFNCCNMRQDTNIFII